MEFAIDEVVYKAHAFNRIARVVNGRKSNYSLSMEEEQTVMDIVNEVTELFATIERFEKEIAEEDIIDAEN